MRPERRQRKKTMNIIQDSAEAVKKEKAPVMAEYIKTIPYRQDKLCVIFSLLDGLNAIQGHRFYSMAYTRGIWMRVWYWDLDAGRNIDLAPQDTRITDKSIRALIGRIAEEAVEAGVKEQPAGGVVLAYLDALARNDEDGAAGAMAAILFRLDYLGR